MPISDELEQSVDIEDTDDMSLADESIEDIAEQSMLEDMLVPIASELDDWANPGTAAAANAPATKSAPIIESSFFISASV